MGEKTSVKVKLWSANETRLFANWLQRLKGKRIRIIKALMNQTQCTVEVHYEVLEDEETTK